MTQYVTVEITGNRSNANTGTITTDDGGRWMGSVSTGAQAIPHSGKWIAGSSNTLDSTGDLLPSDNNTHFDGSSRPMAVVDISSALSNIMGREMSQEKIFYVDYISLRLKNSGSGSNNNEESTAFSGYVKWYNPTQSRIKAYRMYRTAWRMMQKDDSSNNRLFSPQKIYRSLRIGNLPQTGAGGNATIPRHSDDPFSDVDNTKAFQQSIFNAYDRMKGFKTSANLLQVGGNHTNGQWLSGRCSSHPQSLGFTVGIANPKDGGPGAGYQEWIWQGPQISVMNGLLMLEISNSTSCNSWTGANWSDEEYQLEITVGVKGWKGISN